DGLTAADLLPLVERYTPGDAGLRRAVGLLVAEASAMSLLNVRAVERAVIGAAQSVEGNISKLLSAEHAQRVSELGIRIAGVSGVTGADPGLTFEYLFHRALTIAGGTSEVSRNVIAGAVMISDRIWVRASARAAASASTGSDLPCRCLTRAAP
ncbi:acyl-CoA dehydrogenase family protein, partial [Pseudonocardia sp. KRD291]|uniref:acyl-CoA dehydrogenase family protein n=1 Tax=Pseudonocardia sp. KRD291 TaxID=2792007 RepID=UPI001C5C6F7A